MVGEVTRAPHSALFAGVPDEDDRPLRLHRRRGKGLRNLEHSDGSGSVIVRAIEHGVHSRTAVCLSETVLQKVDSLPFFGVQSLRWRLRSAGPCHGQERAQRIMLDGNAIEAEMV